MRKARGYTGSGSLNKTQGAFLCSSHRHHMQMQQYKTKVLPTYVLSRDTKLSPLTFLGSHDVSLPTPLALYSHLSFSSHIQHSKGGTPINLLGRLSLVCRLTMHLVT